MYLTFYSTCSGRWLTSVDPDIITSLYTGPRKYILCLYYPEFLELGTGTCRASASSMLREGDWSHVQDTTQCYITKESCTDGETLTALSTNKSINSTYIVHEVQKRLHICVMYSLQEQQGVIISSLAQYFSTTSYKLMFFYKPLM